ncbi:DUF5060 domain-containing protein [Bacteroidota bacterium]
MIQELIKNQKIIILASVLLALITACTEKANLTGELKKWHKVTLSFEGPQCNESDTIMNPFKDYRLLVTFTNRSKTYKVPGYFAADGNAAETGAESGNIWRVHFCPDEEDTWNYLASFRKGENIATSDNPAEGTAVKSIDGASGSFDIEPTDKSGRDFRGKGLLKYVGEHYLQFAGTGEYFLKQGADAPENLFAYRDFDGNFKDDGYGDKFIKSWEAHIKDWKTGDPTWQDGKGKGLIGAINYLASEEMNVFSFLTMNINGDDKNVFPYVSYDDFTHFDCSKLDQWEIIFEQGTKLGMFLHFKMLEAENELLFNEGNLGLERILYYRELIARFGHNPALNWNLGEEVSKATTEQKQSWAHYFWTHDPYQHHVVIHNGRHNHFDLMGPEFDLTGFSLQTNHPDFNGVHSRVLRYYKESEKAGKPWAVACDEPGDASHGLRPDWDAGNSHEDGRKNGIWGTFTAGGWGNEWYFGYKHDHSDLTCEDFRSRDKFWDYCRYALQFFVNNNIPVNQMVPNDDLVSSGWCLAEEGKVYVVYLPEGGTTELTINKEGEYTIQWYDPRNGGNLKQGSVASISGEGEKSLGTAPDNKNKDWAILVTSTSSGN